MEGQTIFNIVIGALGVLGGFILNAIWSGLKELRESDERLADKVSAIRELVAGQYVRTDRFDALSNALFAKLDKIESKLDGKVSKDEWMSASRTGS